MLTPELENRMMWGLAVQPFVAAALAFALFPLVDYTGSLVYGGRALDASDAAISFTILTGVVASVVTGAAAYPGLRWLLKRGPVTFGQTLLAGFLIGNMPGTLGVLALGLRHLSRDVAPTLANTTYGAAGALRILVFGSILGVASAAVFWLVAGRHLSAPRR